MKHQPLPLMKAAILVLLAVALVACASGAASSVSNDPSGSTAGASETSNLDPDSASSESSDTASSSGVVTSVTKLNLNTASAGDFLTVPGVGDRMVREFMEYRPYTSLLQFRREIGKYVDAAQVAEYEKYVFVPVDVNQADTETLKQLPGVDDAIAADLIAARPYASNAAFLDKLATYVSVEQLDVAQSYLAAL